MFFRFVVFGSVGVAAEIFFRSLSDLFFAIQEGTAIDYTLSGTTFLWMFFIYGLAAFLFPLGHRIIGKYPLLVRLLIIAVGIFVVEFITGFLLDLLIGYCPWEYHTPFAIMGYIRLDYLPFWMGYGLVLEYVHYHLEQLNT